MKVRQAPRRGTPRVAAAKRGRRPQSGLALCSVSGLGPGPPLGLCWLSVGGNAGLSSDTLPGPVSWLREGLRKHRFHPLAGRVR